MRPLAERLIIALFRWDTPSSSPPQELSRAEAIVGLPFGTHDKGCPANESNKALGTLALTLREKLGLPLIMQWELADTLRQQGTGVDVVGPWWHPRFTTYMFFQELRSVRPSLKEIVVVAHPKHLWRCMLVGERFGFEVSIPHATITIPYSRSRHWWASSPWAFLPYEVLVRVYFLIRGWM